MAQYSLYRPWAPRSWSGFDELRREMDALFNRFSAPAAARGGVPAVNLYETEDAYVLTAELPGVEPGAIEVSLEGSTVALRGERRVEYPEGADLHRAERSSGAFRRAFELPLAIDSDKVEAVHRDGVLVLRLPKAPEHKPRQISVKAG